MIEEMNTTETLEKLNNVGFKKDDFVICANNVNYHPDGWLYFGYSDIVTEVISGYIGTVGTIQNCRIYNNLLYVNININELDEWILVESLEKIPHPVFKFDNTIVLIDFENNKIKTNQGDETFENVFKLYGCMLALNKDCEIKYANSHKLSIPLEIIKMEDNVLIEFGCHTGTFGQVRAIVEYIKQNQKS